MVLAVVASEKVAMAMCESGEGAVLPAGYCSRAWVSKLLNLCSLGIVVFVPVKKNRFPPDLKRQRRRETPDLTLCRTSSALFTEFQENCAIRLEIEEASISVKI